MRNRKKGHRFSPGFRLLPTVVACVIVVVSFVSAQDLPKDLDEFLRVPVASRVKVFGQMPCESASAVMSEHVRRVIRDHPEFTEVQRAVLRKGADLWTPDVCEARRRGDAEVTARSRQLERETTAAFTPAQMMAIYLFTQPEPGRPRVPTP